MATTTGFPSNETLDRIHEVNLKMLLAVDEISRRHDIPCFLCFGALLGAVRHHDFIPWDNDVDFLMKRTDFDRLLPYLRAELDPELYEVVMPEDFGKKYFDMVPRILYKKAEIHMEPGYAAYYEGKANRIGLDFFFLDRVPAGFSGRLQVFRLMALYGMANSKRYKLDTSTYDSFFLKLASVCLYLAGIPFTADFLRKRVEKISRKYDSRAEITTFRLTNDNIPSFRHEITESLINAPMSVPIRNYQFQAPAGTEEILRMWYGDYWQLPPEEARVPHWGSILITEENFTFDE